MDPGTVSRSLLDFVRKSMLNFQIQESPFSVNISVRKTFIKDKRGFDQFPLEPAYADFRDQNDIKNNIKSESEKEDLNKVISELSSKLENAKGEICELMKSKSDTVKENLSLVSKLTETGRELAILNSELNHAKTVTDSLKRESKHLQKKMVSKDNELLDLKVENENFVTTVKKNKEELNTLGNQNKLLQKKLSSKSSSSKSTNTTSIALSTCSTYTYVESEDKSTEFEVSDLVKINEAVPHPHPQDLCEHTPQCLKREPRLPPSTFPLNWSDHYNFFEPKAPSNIRILPSHVSSIQTFNNMHNNHLCEECELGSLFHLHHEIVQYPEPGPLGGTSGRPVKTCPNNSNSSEIRLLNLPDQNLPHWKVQKMNQKKYKCDLCAQKYRTQGQLIFHVNRKH